MDGIEHYLFRFCFCMCGVGTFVQYGVLSGLKASFILGGTLLILAFFLSITHDPKENDNDRTD